MHSFAYVLTASKTLLLHLIGLMHVASSVVMTFVLSAFICSPYFSNALSSLSTSVCSSIAGPSVPESSYSPSTHLQSVLKAIQDLAHHHLRQNVKQAR